MRRFLFWLLRPRVLDGCRRLEPSNLARLSRGERTSLLALLHANPQVRT